VICLIVTRSSCSYGIDSANHCIHIRSIHFLQIQNEDVIETDFLRDWLEKEDKIMIVNDAEDEEHSFHSREQRQFYQRLSFTLLRSNAYSISLQSTAATRGS
jgi:hypothetical protein